MKQIGKSIADGAMAFLSAEYRILSIFVVIVAILLAVSANSQGDSWLVSISFLVGAFFTNEHDVKEALDKILYDSNHKPRHHYLENWGEENSGNTCVDRINHSFVMFIFLFE